MTGKGGPGRGQGRKSTLPLMDRFVVCARFKKEWGELAMRRGMDKHKEALPDEDIERSRAYLNSIPVKDRKQLSQEAQEHLDWIGETLRGNRIVRARRPQGEREALLDRIAADESTRRGVSITPRMLKRWLIEYDEFCQD
jgi:hypothetical protein